MGDEIFVLMKILHTMIVNAAKALDEAEGKSTEISLQATLAEFLAPLKEIQKQNKMAQGVGKKLQKRAGDVEQASKQLPFEFSQALESSLVSQRTLSSSFRQIISGLEEKLKEAKQVRGFSFHFFLFFFSLTQFPVVCFDSPTSMTRSPRLCLKWRRGFPRETAFPSGRPCWLLPRSRRPGLRSSLRTHTLMPPSFRLLPRVTPAP